MQRFEGLSSKKIFCSPYGKQTPSEFIAKKVSMMVKIYVLVKFSTEIVSSAFRIGMIGVVTFDLCDKTGVIKARFVIVTINH
jgi:hypothetical protein